MKKLLNNKKILIIIGSLLGIIALIVILFSLFGNKNNDIKNNNSCSVEANDANDFVKKINFSKFINENKKNCNSYEIKYNNLKYVLKKSSGSNILNNPQIYNIDNEIYNFTETVSDNANIYLSDVYLLNDNIEVVNSYLFIFHEVPVTQNPKYYVLAINDKGVLLFSDEFNSSSEVKYDESNKEISYSFVNFKYNLIQTNSTDQEICNIIKEHSDNGSIRDFIDANGVYQGNYKYKYENGSIVLVESNVTTINDIKNQLNCNIEYETIELLKENESFDFDKLHLKFKGTSAENNKDYYNYILDIYYNNQKIDNQFFNDASNYRIWSKNMTGNFKIYKVDNVYILVSYVAKQCFCNEIMIFNTNGDILKTFSRAEYTISGSNITISESDNGQCMGDNWESHITIHKYNISGTKIISE